ncbi:Asp-tRNA(Asn)/Glu-tRNA(Gln) amidotransferase subunit GatC [Patescibacteria group bacterium]|nr:Asp-tRNA(Asn)/Glu-tRNA(Gln) amidotransferase subunit GatC [Patescibacteria group bacterium]
MGFEKDNIEHIADLAKLELSSDEASRLLKDLADILAYVESLQKLKVDNMPDTGQITGLTNQLAADEIIEEYSREELLKNLPPNRQDKGFIKVKSVLGRET